MNGLAAYEVTVRAWAQALRAGEPATWAEFRAGSSAGAASESRGPLPGAAQLEVLRRLALVHAQDPVPRFAALADKVLASAGPGRGLVDPPLTWPAARHRYGPDPVEPELLPGNELVRAISGVLVPLLLEAPARPRVAEKRGHLLTRLLPGRRFTVAGAPSTAAAVSAALRAAGWAEGGPGATHLVLGRDLETMMAEHWAVRTRAGAERRWRPLWRRAATVDRLPPALRIDDLAARRVVAHGPASVHVVVGRDAVELEAGVRAATGAAVRLEVEQPDPAATDLLRRLNPFLVLAAGPQARRTAVRGPWTSALHALAPDRELAALGAPPGLLRWAREAAGQTAAALSAAAAAGDYAVHGDPQVLVPDRHRDLARSVDPGDVVALGIALIVQLWRDQAPEGED